MHAVRAVLKTQMLDGIEVWDKPVGTEYVVDLDSKCMMYWYNISHQHGRQTECVQVLDEDGGYIFVECLELLPV